MPNVLLLLSLSSAYWLTLASQSTAYRANSAIDFGIAKDFIDESWSSLTGRKTGLLRSSVTSKPSWCIAKSAVDDSTLQAALDYACGQTTADCKSIKLGAPCFSPNTVFDHSSYVFNSYYQMNAKGAGTCAFGGAAVVTTIDPSHDSCIFPSSGSLNQTTTFQTNGASSLVRGVQMLLCTCLFVVLV